jgi:predicted GNAT family acetyltransferase
MEVIDNLEMRHFEVRVGERLAIVEYQIQEKKYFLTRAEFPKRFLEEGKDQEMIAEIIEMIKPKDMRIVPMTKSVKTYFKEHPELRPLLPVGIHL